MSIADIVSRPQRYSFDSRDARFADSSEEQITDATGLTEIVRADCTISEEVTIDFEVATSPVEQGADVADHKRAKLRVLTMSGLVTDSPNDALDVLSGNLGTLGTFTGASTRSQDAYERLNRLAERAEPIRVITQREVFESFTITSLKFRKDDAGLYCGFSASLMEVRFATPRFGAFSQDIAHSATPTVDALKEPPVIDLSKSLLRKTEEASEGFVDGLINKLTSLKNVLLQ